MAALLEALEAALPAQLYLDSLIRLLRAEDAALRRRALRLFAARVAASAEQNKAPDEDGCALLAQVCIPQVARQLERHGALNACREEASSSEAYTALFAEAPQLLAAEESVAVRQAALAALAAVAQVPFYSCWCCH